MKLLIYALLITIVTLSGFAQSATLNTPAAGATVTKIVIVDFAVKRDCACAYIVTEQQDAGSTAVRQVRYDVPDATVPSANLQGLIGAMLTTRATETGTNSRKMSFRVLGYLSDQGYLAGVTLVP